MIDCSCYHDEINCFGKRGVCWGTKEREPCSCCGDAAKCDFYPSVRGEEKKPQTNADRIRSMTDEELAEWLCDIAGWLPIYEGKMHPILDWLKQETT